MKKPGFNVWLLILALLLVLAMALTLVYGRRGTSRHGYGRDLSTPPPHERTGTLVFYRSSGPGPTLK